jgi:hypothetical protein
MKTLSPRKAKTFNQICSLQTDGKHTKNSWICLNSGSSIAIHNQRNGEESTGRVVISKREFNALIDWYNREQKTVKR